MSSAKPPSPGSVFTPRHPTRRRIDMPVSSSSPRGLSARHENMQQPHCTSTKKTVRVDIAPHVNAATINASFAYYAPALDGYDGGGAGASVWTDMEGLLSAMSVLIPELKQMTRRNAYNSLDRNFKRLCAKKLEDKGGARAPPRAPEPNDAAQAASGDRKVDPLLLLPLPLPLPLPLLLLPLPLPLPLPLLLMEAPLFFAHLQLRNRSVSRGKRQMSRGKRRSVKGS